MRLEDRLEVEHAGAGRHIRALAHQGELTQQLAVEAAEDGTSVGVRDAPARPRHGVGHQDLAARLVTEADCEDADAAFGRLASRIDGKRIVVFAVRDQQNDPGEVAARSEAGSGLANRLFEACSAARHAARVDAVEHEAQEAEVRRQRTQHAGSPRKRDQPDLVALEVRQEIADLRLRTLEPVRCHILGEHRARHVEGDHDLGTDRARLHELEAPLRAHQGDDRRRQAYRDRGETRASSPAGPTPDDASLHRRCHEVAE